MSDDFSDQPDDPANAPAGESRSEPPSEPWIIPGMPDDVAAGAEREARHRGLALGAWLEEVIQHALTIETAGRPPRRESDSGTGDRGDPDADD